MTLEYGEAVRLLDEHIEVLKQDLLLLIAERKPESSMMMLQKIITVKRELDKAVQERIKLSWICCHNSRVAVPAASA
jgi:hypothetical protein